jgi:hypothetical protein
MNSIEKLEDVVSRLTAEQFARVLAFAQSLTEENSLQDNCEIATQMTEASESQLLHLIQHNFSEQQRQRLRELTQKSEAEELSDDERAEYIALAEQREAADAERLQAVIKLAQRRGISPEQLMEELGVGANANV